MSELTSNQREEEDPSEVVKFWLETTSEIPDDDVPTTEPAWPLFINEDYNDYYTDISDDELDEDKPSAPEENQTPAALMPTDAIPKHGPHPFSYYKDHWRSRASSDVGSGVGAYKATLAELFGTAKA